MICYVYDGSFHGLLTSVYEAYYTRNKPEDIVRKEDFIFTLLTEPIFITTDEVKASKVYTAIKNKISEEALQNIFYAYLSEVEHSSFLIYEYIKLGFKLGSKVDLYLHNDTVLKIDNICKKVTNEAHRMVGFVRFDCINNNLYYSAIEPDHNILTLIAPHFAERLSNEKWIIHDLKRELAAMYNGSQWVISPLSKEQGEALSLSIENEFYQKLWIDYFNNIAVENRINPKLQKMHMPKRYWKHLTEKASDSKVDSL